MKLYIGIFLLILNSLCHAQNDISLIKSTEKIQSKIENSVPVIFLFTDKSIYSPGEKIQFIVSNKNLNPKHPEFSASFFFMLIDEVGSIILHEQHNVENANSFGSLSIPDQVRNGKYNLLCFLPVKNHNSIITSKEIIITDQPAQNAFTEIQFSKSNFIKENEISGIISAFDINNNPIKNADLQLTLVIDNIDKQSIDAKLNENGQVNFDFKTTEALSSNHRILIRSELKYLNRKNSKLEPVPVFEKKDIVISLFPEGGNIVENLVNNVVVQITNTKSQPLHVKGILCDDKNTTLAKISTNSEGYARFKLLANPNTKYFIKLVDPEIPDQFEIEGILKKGIAINVNDNLVDNITLTVNKSAENEAIKTYLHVISGGEVISSSELEIRSKKVVQLPYSMFKLDDFAEIVITDTVGNLLADRVVYPRSISSEDSIQAYFSNDNIVITGKLPPNFDKCNVSVFPSYIEKSVQRYLLSTNNFSKLFDNSESFNLSLYTSKYSKYLFDTEIDTIHSFTISGKVLNKKNVPITSGTVLAINPISLKTQLASIDSDGNFKILWNEGIIDLKNLSFKASNDIKNAQILIKSGFNENYLKPFFPTEQEWDTKKSESISKYKYPQYLYLGNFQKQTIKEAISTELEKTLEYSTYNTVLDIISSKKPFRIDGGKIYFLSQGVSTNGMMSGALIVIDGRQMGENSSALYAYSPNEIADVTISTNPVDIQRYSGLNDMGVIEIKTKTYMAGMQNNSSTKQIASEKQSEYSAFKNQDSQDLNQGVINFLSTNNTSDYSGYISAVNDYGDIFIKKLSINK
jgi:hypothetical protein